MLSNKRPGQHPLFGAIYYWCLSVVFASAAVLAAMRWADDSLIHPWDVLLCGGNHAPDGSPATLA